MENEIDVENEHEAEHDNVNNITPLNASVSNGKRAFEEDYMPGRSSQFYAPEPEEEHEGHGHGHGHGGQVESKTSRKTPSPNKRKSIISDSPKIASISKIKLHSDNVKISNKKTACSGNKHHHTCATYDHELESKCMEIDDFSEWKI